jgi:diacylglycerol O-acyltransferase
MDKMKHLSVIDGAFLHIESAEMPMHVGSLHVFEAPPGEHADWVEAVKEHVRKRMHLAPVFTRKLALMPFDLANPVWIEDDDVDIDYHIRHVLLPRPGSMAQLEALAARLHSSLLDRSRPLWEFYVIEGLADGRIGFYAKVHHAAVDGQAGVALANAVYDVSPEPRAVKPPRRKRGNRYQLGVAELLSAALENQLAQVVDLARLLPVVARTLYGAAREAIANRGAPRGAGGALSRLKLAPATPFNSTITNQRTFAGVSLPLEEVKRIGKAHGASINDMVLWLCSTALRSYLKEARELPGKTLVAAVPVSLRAEGDTSSNNQVTGTLTDLATHIADPLQRLQAIMHGTAAMKRQMGTVKAIMPTDFPSLGSPWLLSGLSSLYGRSRLADRMRLANVTISNVPGPKFPLYLAGARMLDYYPVSIVIHGVALNITVQSYMGQLCFGLIACRRAVPDLPELAGDLRRAMQTLGSLTPPVAEAGSTLPAADDAAPLPSAAPAAPARRKPAPARARPAKVPRVPALQAAPVEPPAPIVPAATRRRRGVARAN